MRRLMLGTALLALTACGGGDKAPEAADGTAAIDTMPERGINVAALWGGGKPMPLDLQATHPGGMVLQLTSLQAKPTETVIGISVVNGDRDEQRLNAYPNNKNGYLLSASGERFYLSPPAANPELRVPAGQKMEGELVFLGRLPKGGGATLVLNDGDTMRNEYSNQPGYRVELPLQDAAFSDDGSKKN